MLLLVGGNILSGNSWQSSGSGGTEWLSASW